VSKSQGLGLEESQMASGDRLLKLVAVAIKAACTDMQLVRERDGIHGLPASTVFAEDEIDTIEGLNPTLERKTVRQQNPHPPRDCPRASRSRRNGPVRATRAGAPDFPPLRRGNPLEAAARASLATASGVSIVAKNDGAVEIAVTGRVAPEVGAAILAAIPAPARTGFSAAVRT
jgi:hypothetical protein